ncbi:MAG: hypothetical protein AB7D26_10580 [Marinobacterium sp.]
MNPEDLDVEIESIELIDKKLIINLIISPPQVANFFKPMIESENDGIQVKQENGIKLTKVIFHGKAQDIIEEGIYISLMEKNPPAIIDMYMEILEEKGYLEILRKYLKRAANQIN